MILADTDIPYTLHICWCEDEQPSPGRTLETLEHERDLLAERLAAVSADPMVEIVRGVPVFSVEGFTYSDFRDASRVRGVIIESLLLHIDSLNTEIRYLLHAA